MGKLTGEYHSDCNALLAHIAELEAQLNAAMEVVEAVAHIGLDFGYGAFELQPENIEMARKIKESYEKQGGEDV